MTNFEKYINNLTQNSFIQSMILNCDGCPVYPCDSDDMPTTGIECEEYLEQWCNEESDV